MAQAESHNPPSCSAFKLAGIQIALVPNPSPQQRPAKDMEVLSIRGFRDLFNGYKDVLAVVGVLYALKVSFGFSFSVLKALRIYFLSRVWRKQHGLLSCCKGKWAVITGASDGIGKAFATEIAKYGIDVVLISRSFEKLNKVAQSLEKDCNIKTHIVTADFSREDVYPKVAKELQGMEIGLLVNNVGVMYDYPNYFLEVPEKRLWEIININIVATVMMTRIVLPQMAERKNGAVINMSSCAAQLPTPQMTVYSAAKDFVDYFSRALHHEYAKDGITIQSLRPYYVSSAMTHHTPPTVAIPSPATFVQHALPTLRVSTRNCGYWNHALQSWLLEFVPERLWMWGATVLNNQIRKTVLKSRKKN